MSNHGIPNAGLKVIKFEQGNIELEDKSVYEELTRNTIDVLNEYYNKLNDTEEKSVESLISDAQEIIENYNKVHESEDEVVFNVNQSSKEIDEVININIKKGESEEMAVKKELDNAIVAEEEVKTPVNFEDGAEEVKEEIVEETTTAPEEEKVEEEAKSEEFEEKGVEEVAEEKFEDDDEDEDEAKDDAEEVEEAKEQECACGKEECACDKEEMSKADRKTYEARIATLENNLKAVKAELKVAAPFKALYEEAMVKIAELESYKEDVELDKLKADKEKYASTCNFNALEDEDKAVVQEKIDDYKFSLYDFKAFMADVLKKYSRKQVYSNMEKIISYFSMSDEETKADDIDLPSDKSQAERILDKYSDVKL